MAAPLYRPAGFFLLRAPILPIEAMPHFSDRAPTPNAEGLLTRLKRFLESDALVRFAILVGSESTFNALGKECCDRKRAEKLQTKLLRYLLRMSTRPTPYGAFAGVGLGQFSGNTDLEIGDPYFRVRPDMSWLAALLKQALQPDAVVPHLTLMANTAVCERGGRLYLPEVPEPNQSQTTSSVSIRATAAVKKCLEASRLPVDYDTLVATLMTCRDATLPRVAGLIRDLWRKSFLLCDLQPPVTTLTPAQYVLDRMSRIPALSQESGQLQSILDGLAELCHLSGEDLICRYRSSVERMTTVIETDPGDRLQVDTGFHLLGSHLHQEVGEEAARAAEILLACSPHSGSPRLNAYRDAFVSKYGLAREIPLLTMLDPAVGLGPLTRYGSTGAANSSQWSRRNRRLLDLACTAMREHQEVVMLDEAVFGDIRVSTPSAATCPGSLELYCFIEADSYSSLDSGDFRLILGPNLGAVPAGRSFGRFLDLLGSDAIELVSELNRVEERLLRPSIVAEVVYNPRKDRSANVIIRPPLRSFEIPFAATPGVDRSHVVPLDELLVGVQGKQFYVRWPKSDVTICPRAGHMLTTYMAPPPVEFLLELWRDGVSLLRSFDWGPANSYPYLPRVQYGRTVLSLREWNIDTCGKSRLSAHDDRDFRDRLQEWRTRWDVPQSVFLVQGDNRLLLDLDDKEHVKDLRQEMERQPSLTSLTLQEALPGQEGVWMKGPRGHHVLECVIPLTIDAKAQKDTRLPGKESPKRTVVPSVAPTAPERLRPPGSDWVFLKLYCPTDIEDEIIAHEIPRIVADAYGRANLVCWFFTRYKDPDSHIRLRCQAKTPSDASRLVSEITAWATTLMDRDLCSRFAFDTYDREVERYGGIRGLLAAETVFCVDSQVVVTVKQLLRSQHREDDLTLVGAYTSDCLMTALALDDSAKLEFLKQHYSEFRRRVSNQYRKKKNDLRSLLTRRSSQVELLGEDFTEIVNWQQEELKGAAITLQELRGEGAALDERDGVVQSLLHMHCNRLFGLDSNAEQTVLGLLLRTREGLAAHSPSES